MQPLLLGGTYIEPDQIFQRNYLELIHPTFLDICVLKRVYNYIKIDSMVKYLFN